MRVDMGEAVSTRYCPSTSAGTVVRPRRAGGVAPKVARPSAMTHLPHPHDYVQLWSPDSSTSPTSLASSRRRSTMLGM